MSNQYEYKTIPFTSEEDKKRWGKVKESLEKRDKNVSAWLREAVWEKAEREGVFSGK